MRPVPLIPTLVVGAAVAIMIALGVWQLRRAAEKDMLIAELATASRRPAVDWPAIPDPAALPLFRRSALTCRTVTGWRATSGRSRDGAAGWSHIATCVTDRGGAPAQVVAGWSRDPRTPAWGGGAVRGTIAPDSRHGIRLVADDAPAGLAPAAPPGLEDIPNNHLGYAVQWFLFALAAVAVYGVALRRRRHG